MAMINVTCATNRSWQKYPCMYDQNLKKSKENVPEKNFKIRLKTFNKKRYP